MGMFKIVAGLGNPGEQYSQTRHNIGFMILDELAGESANWKDYDGSLRSELRLDGASTGKEKIVLVKPCTYMNRSGEPLTSVMRYHKLEYGELVVVHDDIDLEFGSIRIRQGGGDGGHNGVRSVVNSLSEPNFVRVRVGVSRPAIGEPGKHKEVADWVLEKFSKEELKELPGIIKRTCDAISVLLSDGLTKAQQRYSK